jgi:hypothetical protein
MHGRGAALLPGSAGGVIIVHGRSPGISGHSPKDRSSHASRTNKMERDGRAPFVAELRIFDRRRTQSGDFRAVVSSSHQ